MRILFLRREGPFSLIFGYHHDCSLWRWDVQHERVRLDVVHKYVNWKGAQRLSQAQADTGQHVLLCVVGADCNAGSFSAGGVSSCTGASSCQETRAVHVQAE